MELDGKRQRNALTAAERAIEAVARGDRQAAMTSAVRAAELDQIDVFSRLPEAIAAAADPIDEAGWVIVRGSVPAGPLHALIEAVQAGGAGG